MYVGISNYLTLASTLYKNCFQYAGNPLTDLMNENALSFATNLFVVPLTLFLTVPAVSLSDLI